MNNDQVSIKEGENGLIFTHRSTEERYKQFREISYIQEGLLIGEAFNRTLNAVGKDLDEYQMLDFAHDLPDKASAVHKEWADKFGDRIDNGENPTFNPDLPTPTDPYEMFQELRLMVLGLVTDEAVTRVLERHGFAHLNWEEYIAMLPSELQGCSREEAGEMLPVIRDEWEEKCSDHVLTAYLNFIKKVGIGGDEEEVK